MRQTAEARKASRIRTSTGERAFDVVNVILLIAFCILTLYPFWYVLILSLNEGADAELGNIWFLPRKLSLENYWFVIRNPLITTAYRNTILRTTVGSMLTLLITGAAAYVLAHRRQAVPFMRGILALLMLPMFLGGTIVSNYIVMAKLGLLNRFLVYVLPGSFSFFLMIVMRTYIQQIPDSLEESAKLDGANYVVILFRIILPLCMPIVATVLLFSGVGLWLDFYTNMVYVNRSSLITLQYMLYLVIQANRAMDMLLEEAQFNMKDILALERRTITSESLKMATLMVVTLPILFIYPFLQRYFIKGLLIGSLKG